MTKHFILNINPAAKHEWEHRTLRDPITAEHPDLSQVVAEAVGGQPGSYLIAVNIEVTVLEHVEHPPAQHNPVTYPKISTPIQPEQLVA